MIPSSVLGIDGGAPRYGALPPLDPADLATPGPTRRVDVGGVAVNTFEREGRDPPLILIHGLSAYIGCWTPQIQRFTAQGRRVLALDLPGFGGSDRPDGPYSPPWYARLIARWLDAVGVAHGVVVGHSMGGQIAMRFALDHPERVDGLVLAAPAGIETFKPDAADWMRAFWTTERAEHATEDELRANFTKLAFNRTDEHVEALLCERVRMQKHPTWPATARAVSRCIAGMLDHPVRAELGGLHVPTLVVYGSDDRMIPNPVFTKGTTAAIAAEARRALPDARLTLLEGAGHYVQHDDPEGFHAAVEGFLRELGY
ncbi:MAG: alpha/beta hydrolase [Alphaproteobacteria bacterium]|nr:alpha/beta hydrolase [Alphaproteobacteria bacterium]